MKKIQMQEYAQMDYNARACYDRIIPQISSIVIEAFGVHKEVIKLHKEFLDNAVYRVNIEGSRDVSSYTTREK